jgi:hypothetical protein
LGYYSKKFVPKLTLYNHSFLLVVPKPLFIENLKVKSCVNATQFLQHLVHMSHLNVSFSHKNNNVVTQASCNLFIIAVEMLLISM